MLPITKHGMGQFHWTRTEQFPFNFATKPGAAVPHPGKGASMRRQANPAVIGGFIVGASVLTVAGILIFGSGRFFANIDRVVMYFAGGLQGLRVGAAVDLQGVPVGTVTGIKAVIDPQSVEVQIPVVLSR
jgi:hypothetical protein